LVSNIVTPRVPKHRTDQHAARKQFHVTQFFESLLCSYTEKNNLVGTIATEIGLLSNLAVWGMQQGGLTSSIPTEIAKLTKLIFLDLDFNELTGTLSSELLSLSSLTQLDINNNKFTGTIDGIGVFPRMEFMQLHNNAFTGTVPEAVGTYTKMYAFTVHGSEISGTMPQSVCDLLVTNPTVTGALKVLIADCSGPNPNIVCGCCTDCRFPKNTTDGSVAN
jgi:hypothetical protein